MIVCVRLFLRELIFNLILMGENRKWVIRLGYCRTDNTGTHTHTEKQPKKKTFFEQTPTSRKLTVD